MRLLLFIAAGAAAIAAESAMAQSPARGMTTAALADICAYGGSDVPAAAATGYCRGFMIGAGQYHREIFADRPPIFCIPSPSPTFEAAQASFVTWSLANPQYGGELAVDGVMRWAAETYPCPTSQPAPRADRNRRR